MQKPVNGETVIYQKRPVLREGVLRDAGLSIQAQPLITAIMRIARWALNASASSILFSEKEGQRLIFIFADGSSGEHVKRLKISKNSGVAGWVASNGKPLIVNDAYKDKNFNRFTDEVTGHTTKSIICIPLLIEDKTIGVIEVLNKLDGGGFSEQDLNTLTAIAPNVTRLIADILRTQHTLITHRIAMNALLSAIDARETCIRGHSKRVLEYALTGAAALSLSRVEQQSVEYAAILHDIGKLSLRDSILSKSDTLTDEERAVMRKHPVIGFNLLRGIAFLQEASRLVLYHHESYDGNGYPKRLKGNAIPAGARLIAVADAFDNMTTAHSDCAALSKKDALTELHRYAGIKLDPAAVKAFSSGLAGQL